MAENRRPPMPSLITTLGGTIVAGCSRCQSQRNYEFAMDRSKFAVRATQRHDRITPDSGRDVVAQYSAGSGYKLP